MREFDYFRPDTTSELLTLLEQKSARVIAGGTDVIPRMRRGFFLSNCLVDISKLDELRFIREKDDQIEIGTLTTHADLLSSSLLQEKSPALVQAAATIGCPQTRQRGTLGGNLVNSSPAADTLPPLLVLQAMVHLVSAQGERSMNLEDFLLGPGKTSLREGEFLHSVKFKQPTGNWGMLFSKLGKRSGMAIALASAAVYLELDDLDRLKTARLALGSVAPKAVRCPHVEMVLEGAIPNSSLFTSAGQAVKADIDPIDDLRASAAYRTHVCGVLVPRALNEAWQQAMARRAE